MYRLRDLREDRDLNQTTIARLIGTTQQHYSKIEQGKTDIAGQQLLVLADFYGVSTDYLLGRTKNPSA